MNINKKKMKKSILAISMALMVALVCGMGAMTYSKYISTESTGTQQATAAKWGVVINANTNDLFGRDYNYSNGDHAIVAATGTGVSVKANSGTTGNIVAPGTTGSMTISISGVTEVYAKLTFSMTDKSDIYYDSYYPVKWYVAKKEGASASYAEPIEYNNLDEVANSLSVDYISAGESIDVEYKITWAWDFEVENTDNNEKDTIIGKISAGEMNKQEGIDCNTELKFNLSVTVEQIKNL